MEQFLQLEKIYLIFAKGMSWSFRILLFLFVFLVVVFLVFLLIKLFLNYKIKKKYYKIKRRLENLQENSTEKKFQSIYDNSKSFRIRKGIENGFKEYQDLCAGLYEKVNVVFGVATEHFNKKKYSETQKHLDLLIDDIPLVEQKLYKINNKTLSFYKTFDYNIYNIEEAKDLYVLIVKDYEKRPIRYSDISQKLIKVINKIGDDFVSYHDELNGDNNEIMLLSIFEEIVYSLQKVEKTMLKTPELIIEAKNLSTKLQNLYERYNRLIEVGYVGNASFETSYNENVTKLKNTSNELINIANVDKSERDLNEILEFTSYELKIVEKEYESYQNLNSKTQEFKIEQKRYLSKINSIKNQYYKNITTQSEDIDYNLLEDYEQKINDTHEIMESDFNLSNKNVESYKELEKQFDLYVDEFKTIKDDIERIEAKLEVAYDQVGHNSKKIHKSLYNIEKLEELILNAFASENTFILLKTINEQKRKLIELEKKLKASYNDVETVAEALENELINIGDKCTEIKNYVYSFSFSEYLLVHINRYQQIATVLDVEIRLIEDAFKREKYSKVIERAKIFLDKIQLGKYDELYERFKNNGNGFYVN